MCRGREIAPGLRSSAALPGGVVTIAARSFRPGSRSAAGIADLKARNRKVAIYMFSVVTAVLGVSYAAVPLYKVFCQVTGFGGTTQIADAEKAMKMKPEQRLRAGEEIDMPVFFFLDPEMLDDPVMDNVNNVTLSYTFFQTAEEDAVEEEEDDDEEEEEGEGDGGQTASQ
eukprot:jgi/Undpi1/1911/HiC_scaffold_12.g05298.m1